MTGMSRRAFVKAMAAGGLGVYGLSALGAANAGVSGRRPNIVVIYTDDQAEDTVGCLGGKVFTPRIDALRSQGAYLSDCHVSTTVCTASRYSLLTGRYAGRCTSPAYLRDCPPGAMGRIENNTELEDDRLNLARLLKDAGYRTGFVGKSHIVAHDIMNARKRSRFNLPEWAPDADPRDPAVNALMQENHHWWCERIKQLGFTDADGVYAGNLLENFNKALNVHNPEWTTAAARRFIDSAKDQPFFLYYATTIPHGPAPWTRKDGKFIHGVDADPAMTGEGYKPDLGDTGMASRRELHELALKNGSPEQNTWATWFDASVGAILDKLDEAGVADNTLVLYASDHGSIRHGKTTLHEYGTRVPCFVRYPGKVAADSTYDHLVQNIDWTPTFLAAAGLDVPSEMGVDGLDVMPGLTGANPQPLRDALYFEVGWSRAVKTKDWRYIAVRYPQEVQEQIARGEMFEYWGGNKLPRPSLTQNTHLGWHAQLKNPHYFDPDQLYDLRTDRAEDHNIFESHPGRVEQMKQMLGGYLNTFPGRPYAEFTA